MSAVVVFLQNLLADALVAAFTAANARWDLVALISKWYMGPLDAVGPAL